jgi:predicted O-methyltransferase YrrM
MKLRIPENFSNPLDEGLRLESPWIVPGASKFLATMLTGDELVLDIGIGASTLFFARRCRFVDGIETNKKWIDKVLSTAYAHGLDKEIEVTTAAGQLQMEKCISEIENQKYNIISVDTVWGFDRSAFLKLAIPKLKPNGTLLLDNYASEHLFPSTYMWTVEETLKHLSMENTHVAHDFNNRGWQGKGTRIICKQK